MLSISPKSDEDLYGFLHKITNLNATCKSSSSKLDISECINAIDIHHDYHFCSSSSNENQWFSVYFPNVKIFATHYSMQMPKRDTDYWYYPIKWKVYGISSNNEEFEIDSVTDAQFNTQNRTKTFEIHKKAFYNKFKLVMQGLSDGSDKYLRIYKIDFFGKIIPLYYNFLKQTRNFISIHILSSFLLSALSIILFT